jgi:regulator of sirC expression with transglutaminase-like and TPR domain
MTSVLRNLRVYIRYSRGIIRQYTGLRTKNRRHFRAAVRHYSIALGINAAHFDARRCRGLLRWRELNDSHGAVEDFSQLLKHRPDFHDALFFRGMAYMQLSEYRAAAEDLTRYLAQAPGNRWTHSARLQLDSLHIILKDSPGLMAPPSTHLLLSAGDDPTP